MASLPGHRPKSPSASLLRGEYLRPTPTWRIGDSTDSGSRRASGACAPRRAGPSLLAKRPGAWERSAGEAAASPPVCRVTNHPTSRPLSQFAALSASGHPLIIVGHSPPARPADALFGPPVRESTAAGRSSSTAAWTTRRPRRHRWSCARGGESGSSRRGSRSSRPRLAGSIRSHVSGEDPHRVRGRTSQSPTARSREEAHPRDHGGRHRLPHPRTGGEGSQAVVDPWAGADAPLGDLQARGAQGLAL